MRIVIFGINYAPELTGIGKYTGEMAAWLAKQGHDMTAVTGLPYYPEWEIHDGYKKKWWVRERVENVNIYRCPLYVPKNVTSIKRIIHEFSFLLGMLPVWLKFLFGKKHDLVICVSPPFHLSLMPLLYAKIRGVKFITHIQDLQVDAAKDLGMIKNERALDIMFKLEKKIFELSSAVSTISPGMKNKITAKGIDAGKVVLFPNWVDENMVYPMLKSQSLRNEFGIEQDAKVILYSGNLGEKQGLDVIVDVAKSFRTQKNVVFVIVGSGGGKEKLINLVNESGLTNIKFFPLQPYEKMSALLATADLHLVLQKQSASDLVMPSKLTAILAAGGCPIVTATPGTTLYDVISKHKIGILIEPESPRALREAIETALNSDLTEICKNARRYAEQYLSKETLLSFIEASLNDIIGNEPVAVPAYLELEYGRVQRSEVMPMSTTYTKAS